MIFKLFDYISDWLLWRDEVAILEAERLQDSDERFNRLVLLLGE